MRLHLGGRMTADLLVARCPYDAARFAVEHWHYTRTMPPATVVHYGAWEDGRFVGAVLFGHGANWNMLAPFGLDASRGLELTRVALRDHGAPVTQIIGWAIRMLRRARPGLRLLVSYADTARGHHGGIYQAGNWIYLGAASYTALRLHGELVHRRSVLNRYGSSSLDWLRANVDPYADVVPGAPKHRYVYPLDRVMRRQLQGIAQPYPGRSQMPPELPSSLRNLSAGAGD